MAAVAIDERGASHPQAAPSWPAQSQEAWQSQRSLPHQSSQAGEPPVAPAQFSRLKRSESHRTGEEDRSGTSCSSQGVQKDCWYHATRVRNEDRLARPEKKSSSAVELRAGSRVLAPGSWVLAAGLVSLVRPPVTDRQLEWFSSPFFLSFFPSPNSPF